MKLSQTPTIRRCTILYFDVLLGLPRDTSQHARLVHPNDLASFFSQRGHRAGFEIVREISWLIDVWCIHTNILNRNP
jgi:hypothetical protein